MKFINVVENALYKVYHERSNWVATWGETKNLNWERMINWYNRRYCNPDSPERDKLDAQLEAKRNGG